MPGRNRQLERALQREVMFRLARAPLDAMVIGSANGAYFPARTPHERELVKRIVYQLKLDGAINPGVADLTVLWKDGSGFIELKRPASKLLFEKVTKGRASRDQIEFRERCQRFGIPYQICESWGDVRDTLVDWGRLPRDWRDADARIGRAA